MWITSTVFIYSLYADNTSDSIRMQMKYLSGEELLQAHANLCRLAATGDNINNELAALREFINEANRQSDVDAEGLARTMQILCYYNYHMADSLKNAIPDNLAFMHKHGLWNYYYNSWNTLIELHLYEDNLQMALLEADKMYVDAKKNKNNYGIGVSTYSIGSIYQTMQRFPEAKQSLEESILALTKEENISLLLSAYNALGETLDGLRRYEELRTLVLAWKTVLDNCKLEVDSNNYTSFLNDRYLSYTLAAAVTEIETEHYIKAAELLSHAKVFAKENKLISRYKFLQVQTRYYVATKQYDKAIASNAENMDNLVSVGDSVSLLTLRLQQAKLLLAAGQDEEAIELYKNIIPRNDKLNNYELVAQLNELHTMYKLDRLTLKNKIATNRLYLLFLSIILLLVLVTLSIMYARRLRHKNRVLYNTYLRLLRKENTLYEIIEEVEPDNLSNEEVLYNDLCKLMWTNHLYKDQKLKKDDVAAKLNTNRTYLSDAIKKHGEGLTFSEFVNRYRLRYAATLLTTNLDMNIYEIGDESGFNSRSTYYRLFHDYYGMSPSEFRDIAKEKEMV